MHGFQYEIITILGDFSITGTQEELDKITPLCIYGDRKPQHYAGNVHVELRQTTDNYSTFFVDPRQITDDTYLSFGDTVIRAEKWLISAVWNTCVILKCLCWKVSV